MSQSGHLQVVPVEQESAWLTALDGLCHDFYHWPAYHQLFTQQHEKGRLFVYEEDEYRLALPLLLRPLRHERNLSFMGAQLMDEYCDATSVYGYAGPVASHDETPLSVLKNFHDALQESMQELNVISVFSRLHPLISQIPLLAGLGECCVLGKTVSIDLTEALETQWAQYRKAHRYEIRRLQRQGVECVRDTKRCYLDEFIEIYHETMHRVQAQDHYYFDQIHFNQLVQSPEGDVELFVALAEGQVVSAALFLVCGNIVQYHLAGTRQNWTKLAPMKLIIDCVRQWAYAQGKRVFHLGGGLGSQEDSLFAFKAGFSPHRNSFSVWQWLPLPQVYTQICAAKANSDKQQGLVVKSSNFFPAYRAPTTPINEV